MTQAPDLPPLHMRRDAFDPTAELREIRETIGVRTAVNSFGMTVYLVTRHEDIKEVLSDHVRFSNSRPPGFVLPGAPPVSEQEQATARAGNLLGLDPPEHQRLRRMLTAEFTIRRMKRLEPRIVEIVDAQLDELEKAGPPADLVAAHPVAGDLRAARRAVRRPRRLSAPQRPPARPVHSASGTTRACPARPRVHGFTGRAGAASAR
jgi:cytochrome P450